MNNLAERVKKNLLPRIIKPGRYIGNELGAVNHPKEGRVSIALAFPDLYDLGMSNLGLSILYHLINKSPRGRAERVFAVSDDTAQVMREQSIPLFSLESITPIKDFDMLGFNSATELNYTNILYMLDLAGIPLEAKNRGEDDPIVAIGGGCAFNPEPLADFADYFFLGDAEEAIDEIIDCLYDNRELSRQQKLFQLSKIEGVYVPSYYRARYTIDGKFDGIEKLRDDAPSAIKARVVSELKNSYYPSLPVVPFIETVHDRLPVEIMRGCGHGCRFCQASVIYKPGRMRKVDDIVNETVRSVQKTGYDNVTLLSLSSGDYKDIETLVKKLVERLKDKHVTISLPSLRISTMSLELAELLTTNQKSGLTFAPEAGTERLRKVINKPLNEETLREVLSQAFKKGWQTIKLYFMIGLPTETEDDLRGIADLVLDLCRISDRFRGKRNFNITISTFSPKPHTPWQWERQISIDEIEKKKEFLKQAIRRRNVRLKFHSPETSWLEGVLGRGDRLIGKVIKRAYDLGCHMDGWSESFDFESWQKAFDEEGIDPAKYLGERSTSRPLPWEHMQKGRSRETLLKELAKSRGLTELVTSLDKEDVGEIKERPKKKDQPKRQMSFGRNPKTMKSSPAVTVPQSRLRIRWGRYNDARFLSHLDNMRALVRTFFRANLPITFSQGYNPKPKLSYGPPLSLGYTSDAEYIDIQLENPVEQYMIDNLNRQFPPDFKLIGTSAMIGKGSSLSSQLNMAVYEVDLPIDIVRIEEMTDKILKATEFKFMRESKSGPNEIEARDSILGLECSATENGSHLVMKTAMADLGFIKPNEILRHGYHLEENEVMALTIHRMAQYRIENDKLIDPFDIR